MSHSIAVAVFVKTPGVSPLKTRLAKGVGREVAENFYSKATRALCGVLEGFRKLAEPMGFEVKPYWAIAESDQAGHDLWKNWQSIWQGEGDLGQKLHCVYSDLLRNHDSVVLLGADTPQVTASGLLAMVEKYEGSSEDIIIGPAKDGGFYLFWGREAVSKKVWTNTTYSAENTLGELEALLEEDGKTWGYIKELRDVDTENDLFELLDELGAAEGLCSEQKALASWVRYVTDRS